MHIFFKIYPISLMKADGMLKYHHHHSDRLAVKGFGHLLTIFGSVVNVGARPVNTSSLQSWTDLGFLG